MYYAKTTHLNGSRRELGYVCHMTIMQFKMKLKIIICRPPVVITTFSVSTTNLVNYSIWGKMAWSITRLLIEILKWLTPESHLLHTHARTHRHTLPAAISPCCWMPLILVPHLLRWETGDRSNLRQRNVLSLSLSLYNDIPLSSSHPTTPIHIQQIQACAIRRKGGGRGGLGVEGGDEEEGGLVWVIVNSAPALLVAQEWPIISHWAKWHEFININNSSKFVFSGCCTEAQAGPY